MMKFSRSGISSVHWIPKANNNCLSSNVKLLPFIHFFSFFFLYLFHHTKCHVAEFVESLCHTCSSGRDRISIQASSKSGGIPCGAGGGSCPGERVAGDGAGCSGDIIMLLLMAAETAGVSRQTEVF